MSEQPVFFPSAQAFRRWLEKNHDTARELIMGFYKKSSPQRGITYPEAVDEALCFGWIDGIVHRLDEHRYVQRFTPRRPGSIWSLTNIRHVDRLTKAGRMHPAGLAVFAARDPQRCGVYSFEQPKRVALSNEHAQRFRANPAAWKYWVARSASYRRAAAWWVISAKQAATRERRLGRLIASSAAGRRYDAE